MQFSTYLVLIRERLRLLNGIILILTEQQDANRFKCSKISNGSYKIYHLPVSSILRNEIPTAIGGGHERLFQSPSGDFLTSKKRKFGLFDYAMFAKQRLFGSSSGRPRVILKQFDGHIVIGQLQFILNKLEKASLLISSAYGAQIVTILIIKFTILTSLLYFGCMIILR